jgi:hypothetical protein
MSLVRHENKTCQTRREMRLLRFMTGTLFLPTPKRPYLLTLFSSRCHRFVKPENHRTYPVARNRVSTIATRPVCCSILHHLIPAPLYHATGLVRSLSSAFTGVQGGKKIIGVGDSGTGAHTLLAADPAFVKRWCTNHASAFWDPVLMFLCGFVE